MGHVGMYMSECSRTTAFFFFFFTIFPSTFVARSTECIYRQTPEQQPSGKMGPPTNDKRRLTRCIHAGRSVLQSEK